MDRIYKVDNVDRAVGLFDSGLGGLTVLRELRTQLPNEKYIYLGDTARTPYGSKGVSTIQRYARECAQFLLDQRVKLLIVACNTASAVALEELSQQCSCPVIGTIEPAVQTALSETRSGRIGVIGTRATIESRVYEKRLKELDPKVTVLSRACPLFVPLVEEGIGQGGIIDEAIAMYLTDLRSAEVDTIILGCTHYPLLVTPLQTFFGPGARLVECSSAIAAQCRRVLQERNELNPAGSGGEKYFVTDEISRFNSLASLILNRPNLHALPLPLVPGN